MGGFESIYNIKTSNQRKRAVKVLTYQNNASLCGIPSEYFIPQPNYYKVHKYFNNLTHVFCALAQDCMSATRFKSCSDRKGENSIISISMLSNAQLENFQGFSDQEKKLKWWCINVYYIKKKLGKSIIKDTPFWSIQI